MPGTHFCTLRLCHSPLDLLPPHMALFARTHTFIHALCLTLIQFCGRVAYTCVPDTLPRPQGASRGLPEYRWLRRLTGNNYFRPVFSEFLTLPSRAGERDLDKSLVWQKDLVLTGKPKSFWKMFCWKDCIFDFQCFSLFLIAHSPLEWSKNRHVLSWKRATSVLYSDCWRQT